jgi:adenylate kinase
MPKNIILLGAPGSGKGTQSQRITKALKLPYIATGDMLRADTPLGRHAQELIAGGNFVPDELIIDIVLERLSEDDARQGFLLDGFPRTLPQGKVLTQALQENPITHVFLLDVADEIIMERLTGRWISPSSGRVYHEQHNPPKQAGICDEDGSQLIQREDDKPETVAYRLEVYHEKTEPLVAYYEQMGLLTRLDGTLPTDTVTEQIFSLL